MSSTYCLSERFSPAVVVKRDSASNFSRRSKSSQIPSLITGPNASQILAKFSGSFSPKIFQLTDHTAGDGFADLRELRIVLQHFPGDIEREILAVDHAANETQIGRQQISIVRQ